MQRSIPSGILSRIIAWSTRVYVLPTLKAVSFSLRKSCRSINDFEESSTIICRCSTEGSETDERQSSCWPPSLDISLCERHIFVLPFRNNRQVIERCLDCHIQHSTHVTSHYFARSGRDSKVVASSACRHSFAFSWEEKSAWTMKTLFVLSQKKEKRASELTFCGVARVCARLNGSVPFLSGII